MTTSAASFPTAHPPLRRRSRDRMIAGVCGGIADTLGVDVAIVRIAFVLLMFFGGAGVPLYIAAWLLIPSYGEVRSPAERLFSR